MNDKYKNNNLERQILIREYNKILDYFIKKVNSFICNWLPELKVLNFFFLFVSLNEKIASFKTYFEYPRIRILIMPEAFRSTTCFCTSGEIRGKDITSSCFLIRNIFTSLPSSAAIFLRR